MENLKINFVAVIYKGALYALPRPNRHHNVIHMISKITGDSGIYGEQGFIHPVTGEFMNREDSKCYAISIGQITSSKWGDKLFSEDLW